MNNKHISNKNRVLKIQQGLVLCVVLFVIMPVTFILTTDGLIKNIILNNFNSFIFLLLVPIYTTITGLYAFSFNDDQYIVNIKTKCLGMGDFYSSFRSRLELPKDHIISCKISEYFFGLRKIFYVKYIVNNRVQTQKFNISILHKKDRDLLLIYINDIIKENKN